MGVGKYSAGDGGNPLAPQTATLQGTQGATLVSGVLPAKNQGTGVSTLGASNVQAVKAAPLPGLKAGAGPGKIGFWSNPTGKA